MIIPIKLAKIKTFIISINAFSELLDSGITIPSFQ